MGEIGGVNVDPTSLSLEEPTMGNEQWYTKNRHPHGIDLFLETVQEDSTEADIAIDSQVGLEINVCGFEVNAFNEFIEDFEDFVRKDKSQPCIVCSM